MPVDELDKKIGRALMRVQFGSEGQSAKETRRLIRRLIDQELHVIQTSQKGAETKEAASTTE